VTKYEIKSKIIEMAAANPFEGMVTENPYRHIRHFTTLCNTVHQEGVPDEWFKWNLFPYSLAGEAKTWYSFASFKVEGNWNKLTKKFCKKLFPIRKVQHLRRQVITFTQGEEEGIDQAWNRFNEFIKIGLHDKIQRRGEDGTTLELRDQWSQCKALCDIGAQVSVLSSKIHDKVQDHNLDLAPTSTKLIMGDGRTISFRYCLQHECKHLWKMYTNRFLCY
jgi:hypothetical protein